MSFSQNYINKTVYPKGSTVNVRVIPSTAASFTSGGKQVNNLLTVVKQGTPVGRTSGSFFKMKDGDWLQVMFYAPVSNRSYGYVRSDVVTLVNPSDNKQAEQNGSQLINDLVANDIKVYQNLLFNSELIEKMKAKGFDRLVTYEAKHEDLIKKYNERQTAIKNSGLVKTNNWVSSKWQWLQKKWSALTSGVGVAPLVLVAIGGAVGVVSAVLIYYAFKPRYDDSKIDLKESAELTKALQSLSPEEAATLRDNLEKQIDDAYNQGKKDQQFSGWLGTLKNVALLVGGFWLADKFVFSKRAKNG